jgi:hypothetical protein
MAKRYAYGTLYVTSCYIPACDKLLMTTQGPVCSVDSDAAMRALDEYYEELREWDKDEEDEEDVNEANEVSRNDETEEMAGKFQDCSRYIGVFLFFNDVSVVHNIKEHSTWVGVS